jgi:maltose alpha-D-glucosyltransferase / alpha-amylase
MEAEGGGSAQEACGGRSADAMDAFGGEDSRRAGVSQDPFWYKDAIIYELHVRAFCDSDGDGSGDFRGLTRKLDYLQDLGVTALWLLPFYPSPLRDDGYDIADYRGIHPLYGTLPDFRRFLREAHRRGLRVITELVLNHTSDQHPWFQRARRAPPGSSWRDFYVWSDTPDKYKDARVIFRDSEPSNWTLDPAANAFFWHRFYAHQPDLNFDHPAVHEALLGVVDFWLGLGVDGMRLDAVPYLYEREGTSCESLPETHAFLRKLRRHVDTRFAGRMFLAEANQWPEEAAAYFGDGDECQMSFHFPLMPRLFMAIRMEDRFPILDVLDQTPPIPQSCQWALFLRNHDELTLETVTDEDRDFMVRAYAADPQARINLGIRRRLAPLLGNHRRRMELMNGLLFSLPGSPVIYYGDEIGMGDNIYLGDRNGVRTPMQWSADKNAGFSRSNPQKLYLPIIIDPEYHYEAINVEAQQGNPGSLLSWMRRLIALRKRYRAFSRGSVEFLYPENPKVLAFLRRHGEEVLLVVANLSRFVQYVELDLSSLRGAVPVELFGQTPFPPIGERPFLLTLGPHGFYWFSLESVRPVVVRLPEEEPVPSVRVEGGWECLLERRYRAELDGIVRAYLRRTRWFGNAMRPFSGARVVECFQMPGAAGVTRLCFVKVSTTQDESETIVLPLAFAAGADAERVEQERPGLILARLCRKKSVDGLLYDALGERSLSEALLRAIAEHRSFRGLTGRLVASTTRRMRRGRGELELAAHSELTIYRRLEEAPNPDLELRLFLTETSAGAPVLPVLGALEYRRARGRPLSVGVLQERVEGTSDLRSWTEEFLGRALDRLRPRLAEPASAPMPQRPLVELGDEPIPATARELWSPYLEIAEKLGLRTADLHTALAAARRDPDLVPEAISPHYQRSLYQSVRSGLYRAFELLRRRLGELPPAVQPNALRLLGREEALAAHLRSFLGRKISFQRIRCHGDLHLGRVLLVRGDLAIVGFEGEAGASIGERRLRRSALRDVASMLRSFQWAAAAALQRAQDAALDPWARSWEIWSSAAFLRGYLAGAGSAPFLPAVRAEASALLELHLLEKAFAELRLALEEREERMRVPLLGLLRLIGPQGETLVASGGTLLG